MTLILQIRESHCAKNKQNHLKYQDIAPFKAGVHLKAVFPPLNLGLMRISRSHFKKCKNSPSHSTNLCFAVICKFLGDFGGFLERDSFFLKGLVKFGEIRNIEDLICV